MTDTPEIVISLTQTHPHVLVEMYSGSDSSVLVRRYTETEGWEHRELGETSKFWRFRHEESLAVFAAYRVRELRREGVKAFLPQVFHTDDSRLSPFLYETNDWGSPPLIW